MLANAVDFTAGSGMGSVYPESELLRSRVNYFKH